jgi:hypothetical protein
VSVIYWLIVVNTGINSLQIISATRMNYLHQPASTQAGGARERLGVAHPVAILEGALDLYFSESLRRRLTDGSVEKGGKLGSLTLANPLRWRLTSVGAENRAELGVITLV